MNRRGFLARVATGTILATGTRPCFPEKKQRASVDVILRKTRGSINVTIFGEANDQYAQLLRDED